MNQIESLKPALARARAEIDRWREMLSARSAAMAEIHAQRVELELEVASLRVKISDLIEETAQVHADTEHYRRLDDDLERGLGE